MEPDTIDFESKFWIEKRIREADEWRLQSVIRARQRAGIGMGTDRPLAWIESTAIRARGAIRSLYATPEPQCR